MPDTACDPPDAFRLLNDDNDNDNDAHARASSILSQSQDGTVVLIDIPRSLEEAQVLAGEAPQWRLISTPPPAVPFALPEPKNASSAAHSLAASPSPASHVADLMAAAAARSALDFLSSHHPAGPFCLERRTLPQHNRVSACPASPADADADADAEKPTIPTPAGAEMLHGSIQGMRQSFIDRAPRFNLILLDPPWPNRSARRKSQSSSSCGYGTTANLSEMRSLLSSIPVPLHLADGGLVAVWITNKPAVLDLLTSPTAGLLASWGLELVTEWTWLKITAQGEPLFDLDSAWRKPWERLLVAKRIGSKTPPALRSSVIVAVPDAHSRKPCLRGQFEAVLGPKCLSLEVFARSLTAGWWSWGDEVLRFQGSRHWIKAE